MGILNQVLWSLTWNMMQPGTIHKEVYKSNMWSIHFNSHFLFLTRWNDSRVSLPPFTDAFGSCLIWLQVPFLASRKKEGFWINRLWLESNKDNWGKKEAYSQRTNVRRWQCSVKHKQWHKRQIMGEADLKRRSERGNWMTEKGLHWWECVFSSALGELM